MLFTDIVNKIKGQINSVIIVFVYCQKVCKYLP